MYKVKILTIRKQKEPWLSDAIYEYEKRMQKDFLFEWIFAKDEKQLLKFAEKEKNILCLDPKGKELSSEDFSDFFFSFLEKSLSRICIIIGGPTGIDKKILNNASFICSLSKLTFTHQIARLILVEQVYRSLEIKKNTKYHK